MMTSGFEKALENVLYSQERTFNISVPDTCAHSEFY